MSLFCVIFNVNLIVIGMSKLFYRTHFSPVSYCQEYCWSTRNTSREHNTKLSINQSINQSYGLYGRRSVYDCI
jgi:hypothetical protein